MFDKNSLPKFQLDVVSAEEQIFSGEAVSLIVTGIMGELEILANHAPLLTSLSPGPLLISKSDGTEESLVIFGGMIEVQPNITTVLVDAALRAENIDQNAAEQARQQALDAIAGQGPDLDYHEMHAKLAIAVAQLRLMKKLRNINK